MSLKVVRGWSSAVALASAMALSSAVIAAVPAPANDSPGAAIVISTSLPQVVYGTTQNATNDGVRSFDVFYTFTPSASGSYRFAAWPWQTAVLRSGERRLGLTITSGVSGIIATVDAPSTARPVFTDVTLNASETYTIAVGGQSTTATNQCEFTLVVGQVSGSAPDNCGSVAAVPAGHFPSAIVQNLDGASNDFGFASSGGQCQPSITPVDGGGIDHVYSFTAPTTDVYSFELVNTHQNTSGTGGFNGLIYLNTACDLTGTCLGAANNASTVPQTELLATPITAGSTVYVFVDEATNVSSAGQRSYALIVGRGAAWHEISESEDNGGIGSADAVNAPAPTGGQINGQGDQDYFSFPANTNDRVYAWADTGGSSTNIIDLDMSFLDAGGGEIEFDDDDSNGWASPVNEFNFIYSTSCPVIAGAKATSNGNHYWRVFAKSATGTNARYRLHYGVEPASRTPAAEVEPNDTIATATFSPRHYYSGVYSTLGELDHFAFVANVGDRVFIAADGDPERDSNGRTAPNTAGSNCFSPNLTVFDPAGDTLFSKSGDSSAIQTDPRNDYPSQGLYFVARSSGTYTVQVTGQSATATLAGPEKTYQLAIFINDQAPNVTDFTDPSVALTPNFLTDTIAVSASDAGSGICTIEVLDNNNVQLVGVPGLPAANANFTIALVSGGSSGSGRLRVVDCQGNQTVTSFKIDVTGPANSGQNLSNRTITTFGDPAYIPDNTPAGVLVPITIPDSGIVTKVTATVWTEQLSAGELDFFLQSAQGTLVELQTDQASSSNTREFTATKFDDAATASIGFTAGSTYTGSWKPEDPMGLAKVNGEQAMGTWNFQAVDDSTTNSNGGQVIKWTLEVEGTFATRQFYRGTATESGPSQSGIQSIALLPGSNNVSVSASFTTGASSVIYEVRLSDTTLNGSGTVRITDVQNNFTDVPISLTGLADTTAPANTGDLTTQIRRKADSQTIVPLSSGSITTPVYAAPIQSVFNVAANGTVADVNVDLSVSSDWIGRLGVYLNKDTQNAILMNMIGCDARTGTPYPIGLSKDSVYVTFDDESAGVDAHLEPAAGTTPFMGSRQPDGRLGMDSIVAPNHYLQIPIKADPRPNLLSVLDGLPVSGDWTLNVQDVRAGGSGDFHKFRRWKLIVDVTDGSEHYYGVASDHEPQTGICSIALAPGATNLTVVSSFTPGDKDVEYRVELTSLASSGSGTLVITDCAGNPTNVPITLSNGVCPGNHNGDGQVDADDLFAFLDDWFAQNGMSGMGLSADYDGNNQVDADDLFTYLDLWFANNGNPC